MGERNGPEEPDVRVTSPDSSVSSRRQHDTCAICLEHISERAITTPCNHALFDYLCLLTWLLEHDASCPLCKTKVVAVSYDFYSASDFKTFQIPKKAVPRRADTDQLSPRQSNSSRSRQRRQRQSSLPPEGCAALERRKHIYRHNLYSLHVGANHYSGYRNFTPQSFAASAELQSRARKWLRRELGVFEFLGMDYDDKPQVSRQVNNAEFLLEYIMAVLRIMDIKASNGRAEDLIQEFLGRSNARLLLHELEAWLRSPYNDLKDWDEAVQYPEPTNAYLRGVKRWA